MTARGTGKITFSALSASYMLWHKNIWHFYSTAHLDIGWSLRSKVFLFHKNKKLKKKQPHDHALSLLKLSFWNLLPLKIFLCVDWVSWQQRWQFFLWSKSSGHSLDLNAKIAKRLCTELYEWIPDTSVYI